MNYLFFGAPQVVDLSEAYGDSSRRRETLRPLLDILNHYNFTLTENTPFDQEVALDPKNKGWQKRQERAAQTIESSIAREEALKAIERAFAHDNNDYGRKLYLIENCLYGVDIQPIAAQIAKLRFFISLVVDQAIDLKEENYGILPLPNLETKVVAANTLLGLQRGQLPSSKGPTGFLHSRNLPPEGLRRCRGQAKRNRAGKMPDSLLQGSGQLDSGFRRTRICDWHDQRFGGMRLPGLRSVVIIVRPLVGSKGKKVFCGQGPAV